MPPLHPDPPGAPSAEPSRPSDESSKLSAALRSKYTTLLGGAGVGYGLKSQGVDITQVPDYLASSASINGIVSNVAAPVFIGHQAGKLVPENRPWVRAGVQAGTTAAAVMAPSYVTVPVATGILGYMAANKAIQWSGLNRSAYPSMNGPGIWNFTKRNVISTPGKMLTGMFWSGWDPKKHNELTWQERIGAAPTQAIRGVARSFNTEWKDLQGFEKVPGFFIRPVVSAANTLWNKIPGTGMFKSPDAFGAGVANIAWSPVKAAGWLAKAPGRFWKYAWADPSAKK